MGLLAKWVFLVTFISFSLAWGGICPEAVQRDPQWVGFVRELQKWPTHFSIGSCLVEIHTCNLSEVGGQEESEFVADLLIRQKDELRYVPIYIVGGGQKRVSSAEILNERLLLYRFKDRHPDEATGRFEKWAIEAKLSEPGIPEYLEIAYRQQIKISEESKWFVCGEKREKQYRRFPLFHTLRSWWTWVNNSSPNGNESESN